MTSEPNVKGYAPLPQSISNTDTEDDEDEHHHHHHHHQHHHHEHADSTSKEDDQSRISDTTTICQNGRFYPLDETKNISNRARNGRNSFGYSTDNIPIMILDGQSHDDLWKRHDMSPLRRFCLVASVLLCILTILVFLYVLPCDNSSICPPVPEPKTSVSWDKTLEGVELHGRITVIPGNPYNLIFLLRGQQFGDIARDSAGQQQITPEGGGVLSMQGTSGIPLWWVVLKRLPTDINCEILDTDGSGKPDCLVSGEGGLLVSIEPIAGTIHWNSEIHTHSDLPLLLSDLDSDGINDLVSIEITNTSRNLVLLSGKSGKLFSRRDIPGCQTVKLNSIDSSFVLNYTCSNGNGNRSSRSILLKNLIESLNFSQARRKLALAGPLPSAASSLNSYPNQTSADSWDLTPHHRLYVRNAGGDACPADDCRAHVNLTLHRAGRGNESRIWDHASATTFVTRPAILDTAGQAYTAGFALKFWNWTADAIESGDKNGLRPEATTVRQQNLTERVSIVYVNNTEVHVMNASQSELVQLCRGQDCQPSLPRQARSISIADLNGDGIMELISYRSTYNVTDDAKKSQLTSKVQIVKLDAVF